MSEFCDYNQTIDWLYDLHLFGMKFGLKKVEKLLEFLGNPQNKLKIIHVGGTNGKGSVCAMLGAILAEAGYTVGVNTSPHLSEFTERIQINSRQISKSDVIEYANLLYGIRERVNSETQLGYATYFEVVTAMALQYFADNNVDYVILEVGLGGIYDATNVVNPIITVLTNISLDHTEYLGNTLTSVAENKAGIIKAGIPVLTSNSNPEVLEVITKTSANLDCELFRVGSDVKFELIRSDQTGHVLNYQGLNQNYSELHIPLLGPHQGENAALAIGTLDILSDAAHEDWKLSPEVVRNGLENTIWPGRLELVNQIPRVLLDGAHNPAGARALREALKLFEYDNLNLVFGCSEEKDIKSLLQELLPVVNRIFITQADIRRAGSPEMVLEAIKDYDIESEVVTPVKAAVSAAVQASGVEDLVCVCGSLFVVGEARELWFKNGISSIGLPRIHY
jgi:dihydrofolate synthase/folylpolyglutamate synthase